MFDKTRWSVLKQPADQIEMLKNNLSVGDLTARLLINRGYTEPYAADAFMKKADAFLHDPFLMKDMTLAAQRIVKALENDEKITIYGDYDVDGVTSVAVLYMYLKDRGADVDYYIPTRDGEGYGVNEAAFSVIRNGGTKLVITVDTGVTAIEEIEFAASIGLDVVVTDHHKCRTELPSCVAVVNPQREDCEYPFCELSGVGVVFKLVCALEMTLVNCGEYNLYTVKDMCRRYVDLVTLGTIADVMPLRDENRILVHMGLHLLRETRNVGIRALFRAIGIDPAKKISASTIGYTVAPKINAAGRIGNASRAVTLFLASSSRVAEAVAEELCVTNKERQQTENEILCEALAKIEHECDLEKDHILVIAGEHWHQGVIGIVASRITEQFGRPSVLISFDGAEDGDNGIGKGSARSIKGLNLVEALTDSEEYLIKYGGHELAAGLSVKRGELSTFRERINAYVSKILATRETAAPSFILETEITENEITEKTIAEISQLEPYGAGNPEPLFLLSEAKISEIAELSQGKHTRLIVSKGGCEFSAICFGKNLVSEGFAAGDSVDVVCSMGINEFRGNKTVQLIIRDIDYSESFFEEIRKADAEFQKLLQSEDADCFSDEIPKRPDFTLLYTLLRDDGFAKGKQIRMMKLMAKMQDASYVKVCIMLEVFRECGLCEISKTNTASYYIKLLSQSEKKDLTAAPLMKKLLQLG